MEEEESLEAGAAEYALIIQEEGRAQKMLGNFLKMVLNYQYGLSLEIVNDFSKVAPVFRKHGKGVRCVFVIQGQAINVKSTIPVLTLKGEIPLVLLLPAKLIEKQRDECLEMDNVFLCAWEMAFGKQSFTLTRLIELAFEESEIGGLLDGATGGTLSDQMEARLQNIGTLPTIPAIVMRIMRMLKDPATTMTDLEELLSTDPAIVLKIMQVVNSPTFAGTDRKEEWTLKEALVRLGTKQVASIAQQIAMVNCFAKPQESSFDLRRFWEHSVGCTMIADRLYSKKLIALQGEVEHNDYWISALLHDIGKLIFGFFCTDWFEQIIRQMEANKCSFQEAEAKLSDAIDHERIGEILLLKAHMSEAVVEAVGLHHVPGDEPGPLICLVHMANNLCKELGLSCLPKEKVVYDRVVLRALKLKRTEVKEVKEALGEEIVEEIKKAVDQYL